MAVEDYSPFEGDYCGDYRLRFPKRSDGTRGMELIIRPAISDEALNLIYLYCLDSCIDPNLAANHIASVTPQLHISSETGFRLIRPKSTDILEPRTVGFDNMIQTPNSNLSYKIDDAIDLTANKCHISERILLCGHIRLWSPNLLELTYEAKRLVFEFGPDLDIRNLVDYGVAATLVVGE